MTQGKYLITTDEYFLAPDGQSYRAAWGQIEILEDNILGIKTNSRSSNWYAKIGGEKNHIIVAGCQIHYAIKCEEKPEIKSIKHEGDHNGKTVVSEGINKIYLAQ